MQNSAPASLNEAFPHVDMSESLALGLVLPLQNTEIFDTLHVTCHKTNVLFSIGHTAVSLVAHEALVDDAQANALLAGCEVFELISSALRPTGYSNDVEKAVVFEGARLFVEPESIEQFTERAEYASQKLHDDAPILHETVSEIAAKRLAHNEAALAYAIAGAGIMRGLQIRADRKLAS